jgi:replicative DNA helicase
MSDRLPPYSSEAEQGVLGCILLSPRECYNEAQILITRKEFFYDLRNQIVWENLSDSDDMITVRQKLKDKGLLEQVGGVTYLAQLQDSVPSAANLSYYLDIVREKFLLRKIIQVCTNTVGKVYEYAGEADALMDEVERDI